MQADGSVSLPQWGCPRGWKGRLVGWLMAAKNRGMNRAALDALALRPEHRVLEIGFGPGKTLGWLAERLPRGFVAGIDHSPEMARQAARRNRHWIAAGRADLRCAGVSQIPYADASFDVVLAVNVFMFWPEPERDLAEVKRVLRPGGRVVLTLRSTDRPLRFDPAGANGGPARVARAQATLAAAGFTGIRTETRPVGRLLAVSIIAIRPPAALAGASSPPASG